MVANVGSSQKCYSFKLRFSSYHFTFRPRMKRDHDKSLSASGVSEMFRAVAGAPVIRKLDDQNDKDGHRKVLICEAEGSPKPAVSWNINGTLVCTHTHRNTHSHGKLIPLSRIK